MKITRKELNEILRRLGPRAAEAVGRAPRIAIPPGVFARGKGVRFPGAPAVSVESPRPGLWTCTVTGWRPASKNVKGQGHWIRWYRARRRDDEAVGLLVGLVPPAAGKRTVRCRVEMPGNLADPQNLVESLCDALVNAGLLLDDDGARARVETPSLTRGKGTVTVIEIEEG